MPKASDPSEKATKKVVRRRLCPQQNTPVAYFDVEHVRVLVGRQSRPHGKHLGAIASMAIVPRPDSKGELRSKLFTVKRDREKKMAQKEGLEPPTQRLTAACSTD